MKNFLWFSLFIFLLHFFISCDNVTSPSENDTPTDLEIEVISNNQFKLSWFYNKTTEDTITFHIARKVGEGGWNENYAEVEGDVFQFIDNDVSAIDNKIYAYKIRYFNTNEKEYSAFSEAIAYFSPFTYPSDLQIEQTAQKEITITWKDNCFGEQGYKLDKKINDGNWQNEYIILNPDLEIFLDQSAMFDSLEYRVYAFFGISKTEKIADTLFTTLMPPSNLTTSLPDPHKVRLNWLDNSDGEEKFVIDKKVGELDWQENYAQVDSNLTTFVDDIYLSCSTLQYRVKALLNEISSPYSNIDTINVRLNIVGELETPGQANQVFIPGWTAFLADNYEGLQVVDCNNPNSPQITQNYPLPDRTLSVFVQDNFAYVATHSGISSPGMLSILDITDLNNPIITGSANTQGIPKHLFSAGDYAFLAEGENGLSVMYIAGSTPGYLANYPLEDARKVFVDENNIAFVAKGIYGLAILDVSNSASPQLITEISTDGLCNDVYSYENELFLADGEEGLQILDITDLTNPINIKNIKTNGFAFGVTADEENIYLADKEKGLFVIDKSQPDSIYILGSLELESEPSSIHLSGSYIYITDEIGLKIIQVKE